MIHEQGNKFTQSTLKPSTSTAAVTQPANEFILIEEINQNNKIYCSASKCDVPATHFNVEQRVKNRKRNNKVKKLIPVRKSFSVFAIKTPLNIKLDFLHR